VDLRSAAETHFQKFRLTDRFTKVSREPQLPGTAAHRRVDPPRVSIMIGVLRNSRMAMICSARVKPSISGM